VSANKRLVNWPQAFAEVSLLLGGIGLALLADSWTDNKRERLEEQHYVAALLRDFQQTRENLATTVDATISSNEQTNQLLLTLRGNKDTISEADLISGIQSTFMIAVPAPVFGTYEDMVNSGDLRLIQNSQLRLALARIVSEWENYGLIISEGFNQWNEIQVPFMIANLDVVSLYLHNYQGSSFSGEVFLIDRDQIWTKEFQNVLGIAVINNVDQIQSGEILLRRLDEVLELLRNEMSEAQR
jgi:hypothetical protein